MQGGIGRERETQRETEREREREPEQERGGSNEEGEIRL